MAVEEMYLDVVELLKMRMIKRPSEYTLLSSAIILALPIFFLNLWIMNKGNTARIFQPDNHLWIGLDVVLVLLTLQSLLKARWSGFWLVLCLAGAMLTGNLILLITTKNYALAFYALFLLILSGMYLLQLYRHLGSVYYDSGQAWFEGEPRFLPGISGEYQFGKGTLPVRVSRLGSEGCFVFAASPFDAKTERAGRISLKLGTLSLETDVQLVSRTKSGFGRGLRFVVPSSDCRKDISDFIDRVRSTGYVS